MTTELSTVISMFLLSKVGIWSLSMMATVVKNLAAVQETHEMGFDTWVGKIP